MFYVYMLYYVGYSFRYFGVGVKKGIKVNFQRDDLIQENWEVEGIGFYFREGKKEDFEYGFKESLSYLVVERRNRCQNRWRVQIWWFFVFFFYGFKLKLYFFVGFVIGLFRFLFLGFSIVILVLRIILWLNSFFLNIVFI